MGVFGEIGPISPGDFLGLLTIVPVHLTQRLFSNLWNMKKHYILQSTNQTLVYYNLRNIIVYFSFRKYLRHHN